MHDHVSTHQIVANLVYEPGMCTESVPGTNKSVGIWVEQIVPHRLDVGMVLGL